MIGQWIKWEPISGLEEKYFIKKFSDDNETLDIFLSGYKDSSNKVQVTFENSIYAYNRTDESFRQKIIHELNEKYGASFYGDWTFFKINNSSFTNWLGKTRDANTLIHFCFVEADSIVDVIASQEPKVKFIYSNEEK